MTIGQWLAHLEDVSSSWELLAQFLLAGLAASVLLGQPVLWLVRRGRPTCGACGRPAQPGALHWCRR